MAKSKGQKQKLTPISVGISELQQARIDVLRRVTGKGQARIVREAIDVYFAQFSYGGTTLGEAEARLLDRRRTSAEVSDRGTASTDLPGEQSPDAERDAEEQD